MQPEVMLFFGAVICAVIKIIQLAIIWDKYQQED